LAGRFDWSATPPGRSGVGALHPSPVSFTPLQPIATTDCLRGKKKQRGRSGRSWTQLVFRSALVAEGRSEISCTPQRGQGRLLAEVKGRLLAWHRPRGPRLPGDPWPSFVVDHVDGASAKRKVPCPLCAVLAVCRYVERNPLRARLVRKAEDWRWCSLWHRIHGTDGLLLDGWPVPVPESWLQYVNGVESEAELEALRRSAVRGAPFGEESWQRATAERLGLGSTLRSRGRPHKPRPEPL
jgi:hypothetical protein